MTYTIGEQTITLNKGDVLFVDSCVEHSNGDGNLIGLFIPEVFLGNYKLAKKNLSIKKPYFSDTDGKIYKLINQLKDNKYFKYND